MRNVLIGLAVVLVVTGCSSSTGVGQPAGTSGTASATGSRSSSPASVGAIAVTSPTAPPAPGELIVRGLMGGPGVDHFGWVRAPARRILATYFAPGQRYLGGQLVAPTDEIIVIKAHGAFDHSAPPGGKTSASLELVFYDVTTSTSIPFFQMWDGDAPDLGVGTDPGIADRALAVKRWDLRLMGTTYLRTP